jgi:hypothetical protein
MIQQENTECTLTIEFAFLQKNTCYKITYSRKPVVYRSNALSTNLMVSSDARTTETQ